jgi:hypothetical protein
MSAHTPGHRRGNLMSDSDDMARLIAAAPELLEALSLLDKLRPMLQISGELSQVRKFARLLKLASAAIAKAVGP